MADGNSAEGRSRLWSVKRPLNLHEMLQLVEEMDSDSEEQNLQSVDVVLVPPDDHDRITDEDSGDEDCQDPDRLNKHQLSVESTLVFHYSDKDSKVMAGVDKVLDIQTPAVEKRKRKDSTDDETEELGDKPADEDGSGKCDASNKQQISDIHARVKRQKKTASVKKRKTKKKLTKMQMKERAIARKRKLWKKKIDLECNQQDWPKQSTYMKKEQHPLEFLELFLDHDLMTQFVKYIVRFASISNPGFQLSVEELYCFIGVLYLSGYNTLPRKRMYWEDSPDCRNSLITKAIRRDKFEAIFRYLHVADNNELDKLDRFAKVRPMVDSLNTKFIQNVSLSQNMSIDESMIPYFGKHGCKQYMKSKPIRFGYKAWVLALSTGYCVNLDLYQGKKKLNTADFLLGESVLLQFGEVLSKNFPGKNFALYVDNFFASPRVIASIGDKGFFITGTVRADRTDFCPLTDIKVMKKMERGATDHLLNKKQGIIAVRWNDNSVVTVMSNQHGVEPIQKATRYVKEKKARVGINQPYVIHQYNRYMGGVDLMDNNVANYRIHMRGKKWYIPIIMWLLDVTMNNAWLVARDAGKKIDQLGFRRAVVLALLTKYGSPALHPGAHGHRKTASRVNAPTLQSGSHIVVIDTKRRRCALCKSKTNRKCLKCEVPVHDKCFAALHFV